jgi:glc operon protein GlcG
MKALGLLCVLTLLCVAPVVADDAPPQYGEPIDLETARKVLAGAQARAQRSNWPVAIAIVDNAGFLVVFERRDNTQLGSVQIALEKAKTSALFRRPTKAFEDRLAEGGANLKLLRLPGGLPMEGGLPILVDGKVIGAIGVSGVTSTQDGIIAQAGLDALVGASE